MKSKRGSSAVFLMMILASLISITLALIYGVRAECAKSRIDGIVNLAGDSLMSEFNLDIQKEYGLFMMKGSDRKLAKKFSRYIRYSTDEMKDVEIEKINVSGCRFSAADTELIKCQILEHIKLTDAGGGLSMGSIDTEKEESITENRALRHGPTAVSLPSAALPDKSLTATARSIAENAKNIDMVFEKGADTYLLDSYILKTFNSKNKKIHTEHFFANEVEYILAGELSDQKNERRIEMALKAMRFPLNLAHIYEDAEKRAATFAMAEVMTPGPAAPATQAVLASTWAYAESDNDIELLWQGYKVPMIKDKGSWAMDLDSAVEGITGGTAIPDVEKGYDYDKYLRILLFFKDETIKISRVLDLIQINMRVLHDSEFLINEYFTGIGIEVRVNGVKYSYEKKY